MQKDQSNNGQPVSVGSTGGSAFHYRRIAAPTTWGELKAVIADFPDDGGIGWINQFTQVLFERAPMPGESGRIIGWQEDPHAPDASAALSMAERADRVANEAAGLGLFSTADAASAESVAFMEKFRELDKPNTADHARPLGAVACGRLLGGRGKNGEENKSEK